MTELKDDDARRYQRSGWYVTCAMANHEATEDAYDEWLAEATEQYAEGVAVGQEHAEAYMDRARTAATIAQAIVTRLRGPFSDGT